MWRLTGPDLSRIPASMLHISQWKHLQIAIVLCEKCWNISFILIKVKRSHDFVTFHCYFVQMTPAAVETQNASGGGAHFVLLAAGLIALVSKLIFLFVFFEKTSEQGYLDKTGGRVKIDDLLVSFVCFSSKTQTSCTQCGCFKWKVLFVVKSRAQLTWPPPRKCTCFVCTWKWHLVAK